MARPSKWPAEFRERAVQLYRDSEGRTIAEVALELGVGRRPSASGCARTRPTGGALGSAHLGASRWSCAKLRRENAELRRTNEILRLATSFFAQELDPTRRRP